MDNFYLHQLKVPNYLEQKTFCIIFLCFQKMKDIFKKCSPQGDFCITRQHGQPATI